MLPKRREPPLPLTKPNNTSVFLAADLKYAAPPPFILRLSMERELKLDVHFSQIKQ